MERCVHKHLHNYLHANKLIYEKQSGFLPGHSTVFQLIDIYHNITHSLDNKLNTCMVFCDISKAFDRVWHKGLIFKLNQNGIEGPLLNWLNNYLSNRSQQVFVGTSLSKSSCTYAGVPQGSVLGPLLFLIYINDITNSLLSLVRIFADDTSLPCSTSNISDLEGILNHDLSFIQHWSNQWLVDFNPKKTEAIMFSSSTNIVNPQLIFNNVPVTFVHSHKHLGVTFSDNGKWHDHINNILKSTSRLLGIMRNVKFTLRRSALNQIYISFLRPILEYASVVWDNCTLYEKDQLDKVQNKAARLVTGATMSISLDKLYREIGWISLSDRRLYQKLIIMYKFIMEWSSFILA